MATRFEGDAWTSATRTPPFYPDAVTLSPAVAAAGVLARIDATAGCSVKDSFASLDLSAHGFRVLFDAEWIVRPSGAAAPAPAGPRWERVTDRDAFAQWKRARSGDDGSTDVLVYELLEHNAVSVVAAREGERIVAGAILNHSERVVGVSNFFTVDDVAAASWRGLVAFIAAQFPGSTVVGYESGDDLAAALGAGFEVAGPLRVWIRDDLGS